jgi:hypothetical protein
MAAKAKKGQQQSSALDRQPMTSVKAKKVKKTSRGK